MRQPGFRQRAPFILIENYDAQKNKDTEMAWSEIISILQAVRPEKVHSFKVVVNFVREDKSPSTK